MEEMQNEFQWGIAQSVAAIFFLALIGAGVLFGFQTWKTLEKVEAKAILAREHLLSAAKEFLPENFSQAKQELEYAKKDIDLIVQMIESASIVRYVPFWSKRYDNLHAFTKITQQFISTGVQLASVVEYISEPIRSSDGTIIIAKIPEVHKRTILLRTVQSIPNLQALRASLELMYKTLVDMPDDSLEKSFIPIKTDLLSKGEYIMYTIDQVLPLAEAFPSFVGYNSPKQYLIILQDPSELRATGGLAEMYSVLKVKDATILALTSKKIRGDLRGTGFGRPSEIRNYTKQTLPSGFLQDVNWQNDFSRSAQQAVRVYENTENSGLDGVIALTPEFFISLLRMTGDIRIGDTIWSSKTFLSELHSQLESGSPPIGKLTRAIIDAVNAMSFQQMYDVTKLIGTRLNEKHILLWFQDQTLQNFARKNNWTGELPDTDSDFFMVSDSNMASKKTDPFIERTITRELRQDEFDNIIVSVEILYRNNATITPFTDRYRNFVRIFAPKGSEFARSAGFFKNDESREPGEVRIGQEGGYTVFEGFTVVEPFQNQKIQLEYLLPQKLAKMILKQGAYTLITQKQPGSYPNYTASFFFLRPVKAFSNGGFFTSRAGGYGVQFNTDLRVDREFRIEF